MSQQTIYIPPNTARTVVFPLNTGSKTFYTNFYSPDLTRDQVSIEEVNQFFSKIHSAFHDPRPVNIWTSFGFTLLVSYLLPLAAFIILIPKNMDMMSGEGLFFYVTFVEYIIITLVWFESRRGYKPQPVDPLFERCQDVVDEHNEILRGRGLRWRLPEQFPLWIELTKDEERQAHQFQVESEERITFSLRKRRYSKNFYLPEMTDGKISHEEMHEFISQINTNLRRPFVRLNPAWFVCLLFCDAWILALYKINHNFPEMLSSCMNFVIVIILLFISMFIYSGVESTFEEKFRAEFTTEFQGCISEFNENLRNRGLRWCLPGQFPFYIELCKDYKNQNLSSQQNEIPLYSQERNSNKRLGKNQYAQLPDNED